MLFKKFRRPLEANRWQMPAARLVRIADVFDALTSDRPYRKAYSLDQALEIMEKQKTQFDPKIYKIFLQLVGDNKILPPPPT